MVEPADPATSACEPRRDPLHHSRSGHPAAVPAADAGHTSARRACTRRLPEYPGNFFQRQFIDLAVLAGLGLLLGASLAAAVGTENLLSWLLLETTATHGPSGRWLLGPAGFALGIGVNTLLSIAVLTGLP